MQEWYFGWEKVSCLEKCPYRVFHCTYNGVAPSTAKNHITKQFDTASSVQTAMGVRGVSH